MGEEETPFVFEEHILPMDYTPFIKETERRLSGRIWIPGRRKKLEEIIERLQKMQKKVNEVYPQWQQFFELMKSQGRELNYFAPSTGDKLKVLRDLKSSGTIKSIFQEGFFYSYAYSKIATLSIKGKGKENIRMIGNPSFDEIGDEKTTGIRSVIGTEKVTLRLNGHVSIPRSGINHVTNQTELFLNYWFKSRLELGTGYFDAFYKSKYQTHFSKDPFKKSKDISFLAEVFDSLEYSFGNAYFYGTPGRVFLRDDNDALNRQLEQICGSGIRAEKFVDLQGELSFPGQDTPFYVGKIRSTGSFPFIVHKDDLDGRRERQYSPISGNAVPIKN